MILERLVEPSDGGGFGERRGEPRIRGRPARQQRLEHCPPFPRPLAARCPCSISNLDPALAARDRLLEIAASDTGQSRRVANFLLAWWNAGDCGGFHLTDLWMLDAAISDDILTVARLIAARHEYPTAYGLGPQFQALVAAWRPHLAAPPERHCD